MFTDNLGFIYLSCVRCARTVKLLTSDLSITQLTFLTLSLAMAVRSKHLSSWGHYATVEKLTLAIPLRFFQSLRKTFSLPS